MVLNRLNQDTLHHSLSRAVIELCSDNPFEDIISHAESLSGLIHLYSQQNTLLLESITILVDRGFLTLHNPNVLIKMAESIQDQPLRSGQ